MKKDKKFIYILILLICFLPRLKLASMSEPLRTLSDELSTINGAAILAGYDWSGVVSNAGYYGFGSSFLLGFLFRLFNNPVLIYRIFLGIFALIQSIPGVVAYYILSDLYPKKNKALLALISIMLSYIVAVRANVFYNEHFMILASWLIALMFYMLIKHGDNRKLKVLYTSLLMVIIAISLLLHTRSQIYLIALALTVVLYLIIYRKSFLNLLTAVSLSVAGITLINLFIKLYQLHVWGTTHVRNASVNLNVDGSSVELFDRIKAILMIFTGQLNTFSLISGSLITLAVLLIISVLIKALLNKDYRSNSNSSIILITGGFFSLCFFGTMLAQSISWSSGLVKNITEGTSNSYYPALTYIRYAAPYFGPMLLAGFIAFFEDEKIGKYLCVANIVLIILMQLHWVKYIVPYCVRSTSNSSPYICFSFSQLWTMNTFPYKFSVIVLIGIALLTGVMFYLKKYIPALLLLCIFMVYQYSYNAISYDITIQKQNSGGPLSVYNYVTENDMLADIPKNRLYGLDLRDVSNHQTYYLTQFYFFDYPVNIEIPESYDTPFLIVTNSVNQVLKKLRQDANYEIVTFPEYFYSIIKYVPEDV